MEILEILSTACSIFLRRTSHSESSMYYECHGRPLCFGQKTAFLPRASCNFSTFSFTMRCESKVRIMAFEHKSKESRAEQGPHLKPSDFAFGKP